MRERSVQAQVSALGRLAVFGLLVALVTVLSSCSYVPSRAVAPVPQYNIQPGTLRAIDKQILAASVHARHESEAYAQVAMGEWLWRVQQRIEDVFIPWYSSYGTQQWIDTKVAWYKLWYTEGEATPEEQLVGYLQEQFYEQVLEPVRSFVDPHVVMADAADSYLRELEYRLDKLPLEYRIPVPAFNQHLESIPAIVVQAAPLLDVSLYDALQVADITGLPAYERLLSQTPRDEDVNSTMPLSDKLDVVARRAVTKLSDSLVLRGSTMGASTIVGGFWGLVISAGATAWNVAEHNHDIPEMEAQLLVNLDAALDVMWQGLVEDQHDGVMALVHHMSTQIEQAVFHPLQAPLIPYTLEPAMLF